MSLPRSLQIKVENFLEDRFSLDAEKPPIFLERVALLVAQLTAFEIYREQQTLTAAGSGDNIDFTKVPEDEWWIVDQVAGKNGTAARGSCDLFAYHAVRALFRYSGFMSGTLQNVTMDDLLLVKSSAAVFNKSPQPLILGPGENLRLSFGSTLTASDAITVDAHFRRFKKMWKNEGTLNVT